MEKAEVGLIPDLGSAQLRLWTRTHLLLGAHPPRTMAAHQPGVESHCHQAETEQGVGGGTGAGPPLPPLSV